MKKKVLATLLIVLACACVWIALRATQNAGIAWAGVIACAAGAVKLLRKSESNGPHEAKEVEAVVYITRDGDMFHANSSCQYIYGKEKMTLSREDAIKQQYKPCKRCYPYARR